MLNDLKKALEEKEIDFRFTEAASAYVARASYHEKYGARNMRRFIQREVEDVVADRLISGYADGITEISLDSDGEKLLVAVM